MAIIEALTGGGLIPNPWENQTAQPASLTTAQPGLINSTATATPGAITATGYDPTKTTINQPTDTVQGQIKSIIDQDSPLMQQANTRSLQEMNKRGLVNSTMALEAGQGALYSAATPIAQQDASTYSTVNRENTAAANTAKQFGAAAGNTASSQNAQLQTNVNLANTDAANKTAQANAANTQQANLANADLANRASQFNASQSNDLTKLGMDISSKQSLANVEASYKILMQGNQSASEIYKQAVKNITDVMVNTDLTPEARNTAVSNQIDMLAKGLEITGAMANLDLAQYLDFTDITTPG